MKKGLFGTDGIRGKANEYPITPEVILNLGRAVVCALRKNSDGVRIVIGKDTRISGDMIESAICAGICAMGGDAFHAGIIPTPGVAFLTVAEGFDAGVMISASHNPYDDNGIKIFNSRGFKLSDRVAQEIEGYVLGNGPDFDNHRMQSVGRVHQVDSPESKYLAFLKQTLPAGFLLNGFKLVLDCSNGATYRVAPQIFSDLGAEVFTLFASPDGKNINDRCGSQHTGALEKAVVERRAHIGLAFDGDGDRLIAVDENGKTVTGDQMLAVFAKHLKVQNRLKNNMVVSTVMSNVGLHQALKGMDINHVTTAVGDRYVLKQMIESNAVIGGEDSGHMIFLDYHTSGDGILTALQLIRVVKETGRPLSALVNIMQTYPQVLMNVEVKNKTDIFQFPEISRAIKDIQGRLGDAGRVLVRYSGTQPLCRVMVEGPDRDDTRKYCREIADLVRRNVGV